MGKLEDRLIPGEAVAYQGHKHWIVLFWTVTVAVLLGAAGLAMIYEGLRASNLSWLAAAGGALLVIALVVLIQGSWRRRSVRLVVTNRRIIIVRGIMDRKTEEILLHKVESIGVEQGVWGRMLGYGRVTFRGIGGTYEPLDHVAGALELRRPGAAGDSRRPLNTTDC
jgi:membrane protein YdbS with pleckstrin-like domain